MEQTERHPEKAFKITIDGKKFEWNQQHISGAEIKRLVGARPEYGVWLIVPGPAEDKEIGDQERVDLAKPGTERFITGPKQTTEGDGSFLPTRDRTYLEEKQIVFQEVTADGQRAVILRNYQLPIGRFDAVTADVLIILPPGYSDVAPDMFYTLPWLKVTERNAFPAAAEASFNFGNQAWQRWSRHNPEWRAGIDGIWSMLKRIDHALQVAK